MKPPDDEHHLIATREEVVDNDESEADESDASVDGVATSLQPGVTSSGRLRGNLAVWDRRLTRGAKLRRGVVAALAVLLALAVIFGGRFPILPALVSSISRVLTMRQPAAAIPTARALTAHAPIPLTATPWQEIALPTPHDMLWSYAPVPSDPSTVYVCAASARYKDNPTILWRSRDAGSHWQQMPVVFGNDTACSVQVADDGMGHVSVLVDGGSADMAWYGCDLSALYLSRDNGVTWRALDPGAPFPLVEPNSACSLTLTPHHLYAYHQYSYPANTANAPLQLQSFLMRSDDGRAWTAADADIDAFDYFGVQILPERDDDTLIANVGHRYGDEYGTVLWRSSDAGKHWRTIDEAEGFHDLMVSQEPVTTRSAIASRMLYGLLGNYAPEGLYRLHAIESSDGQHWEKLPPLPVPGTAPDRVGVREVVGVAAGGKLLFLGVDPHAGVPTPNPASDDASDGDQWLWAWDPHAQRWEVPQSPLQVTKGSPCADHCWQSRLAWGPGPDGTGYGTYVWVMHWGDISQGDSTSMYRTFIPAS